MKTDKTTATQTSAPRTEPAMSPPSCQPKRPSRLERVQVKLYTLLGIPELTPVRVLFFWAILLAFALWQFFVTLHYLEICKLLCEKEIPLRKLIWKFCLAILMFQAQFYVVIKLIEQWKRNYYKGWTKEESRALREEGSRARDMRVKRAKNLKDNPVLTFQLDEVIRRYAWQMMLKDCGEDERFELEVQELDFTCEFDWAVLDIEHKVTKFSPKVKDGSVMETHRGEVEKGKKWMMLWESYYDNQADRKQSYAFKGSHDTTTWVGVDLKQCYTVKKQVCVKLNLPQCLQVGIDNTLNLTKVKGEVFQKAHTWEINSQVEVEPSSRAHAQLSARQECSVYEFEIRTTLSARKGVLPVLFTPSNDRALQYEVNIKDLLQAFRTVEEGGVLTPEEKACLEFKEEKWLDKDGVEHSTTYPQIITRGTCVCLSWTDQRVDINTSPLSMDESTSDGNSKMN
ncbi:uncharacterized protein LOC131952936 [Physella acuta]|uniref:uncharacterized protein LOC131952936 n=1 Tax=Physella acuta TaxID=109671 RepID=UPI0027DBBDF3|nr:uncharacterized protein LOC131952936 [Physella acuta]